jgi:hypothetical protein
MTIADAQAHQVVDPTTSAIVPGFSLSKRLHDLENKRVGLIDDAKENARELLEEFSLLLNEKYGVTCQEYHQKPSAGKPTEPDIIKKIAEECDFVIVAIGS